MIVGSHSWFVRGVIVFLDNNDHNNTILIHVELVQQMLFSIKDLSRLY